MGISLFLKKATLVISSFDFHLYILIAVIAVYVLPVGCMAY